MKPRRIGHSLLAALAVVIMVVPYGQPLVCELTDHSTMPAHHQAEARDTSSPSSDDDGLCHGWMSCSAVSVARASTSAQQAPTPAEQMQPQIRPQGFISANLQPPLTPPPRA